MPTDYQMEQIENSLFEACETAQAANFTPGQFLKMLREAWREARLRRMEADTYYFSKLVF